MASDIDTEKADRPQDARSLWAARVRGWRGRMAGSRLGALILALMKRKLDWSLLRQAMDTTAKLSAFVIFILVGARVFSLTFYGVNGHVWVEHLLTSLPGGQVGFLVFINVLIFLLAFGSAILPMASHIRASTVIGVLLAVAGTIELAAVERHRALDRRALARHVDQQIGMSGMVHLVGEHAELGRDAVELRRDHHAQHVLRVRQHRIEEMHLVARGADQQRDARRPAAREGVGEFAKAPEPRGALR